MVSNIEEERQNEKDENALPHTMEELSHTVEASIMGADEPMEEEHPYATGAMVSLTYPIVLILILLALCISAIAWW